MLDVLWRMEWDIERLRLSNRVQIKTLLILLFVLKIFHNISSCKVILVDYN